MATRKPAIPSRHDDVDDERERERADVAQQAQHHHRHDHEQRRRDERDDEDLRERRQRVEERLLLGPGSLHVLLALVLEERRQLTPRVKHREEVVEELFEVIARREVAGVPDGGEQVVPEHVHVPHDHVELVRDLAVGALGFGHPPEHRRQPHPAEREGVHVDDGVGQRHVEFAPSDTDDR
jgi:hypothetical protein